jgi:integrase
MVVRTLRSWVKLAGAAAGLGTRLRPHQLRHTALAIANDVTGDLRAVMEFARHSDTATTVGYTRTTTQKLMSVAFALTRDSDASPDSPASNVTSLLNRRMKKDRAKDDEETTGDRR